MENELTIYDEELIQFNTYDVKNYEMRSTTRSREEQKIRTTNENLKQSLRIECSRGF